MSKVDVIRGLYAYNEWANDHVLDAAVFFEIERDGR